MILTLSPCSKSRSQGVTLSSDHFVLRLSSGCFPLSPLLHYWWKHVNSGWQLPPSYQGTVEPDAWWVHPLLCWLLRSWEESLSWEMRGIVLKGSRGTQGIRKRTGQREGPQERQNFLPWAGSLESTWDLCLCVVPFATPWTAACQASLPLTISWSLPKFMFVALVMPSSHLVLWRPLLLLPSIFPRIRDFSNELSVCIRWPNYCICLCMCVCVCVYVCVCV